MPRSMSPPWWRDSNQTASGKPGAVQSLEHHEIIEAVAGQRGDLLDVRRDGRRLLTGEGLLHYVAQEEASK